MRKNIRCQQHWKVFKTMDRNDTILAKREVKDNILADRRDYTERWTNELKAIYSRKVLPALPSNLQALNNTDLQQLRSTAIEITVTEEDVRRALAKTKSSKAPGINQID